MKKKLTNAQNDLITWLIDEAPESEKRSMYEMTKRVLVVNLAAIHTTSNVADFHCHHRLVKLMAFLY